MKRTNIIKVVVKTLGSPAFKAEVHYIGGKSKVHKTLILTFDFVSELPKTVQNIIYDNNVVVCGNTAVYFADELVISMF